MKTIFMQRKNLEIMIYDIIKVTGATREAAVREIDEAIKAAEPDAKLILLDEFSARSVDIKR